MIVLYINSKYIALVYAVNMILYDNIVHSVLR